MSIFIFSTAGSEQLDLMIVGLGDLRCSSCKERTEDGESRLSCSMKLELNGISPKDSISIFLLCSI